MNAPPFQLRPIRPEDDSAVAAIIRRVMPEFGADGPGFAIHDPEVAGMSSAYSIPRAAYWVVEVAGRVVGGGGIAPLSGGETNTAELRKMYFLPEARGLGAGSALLRHLLRVAQEFEFAHVYLETLTGMDAAQRLYEHLGFRRLDKQLGSTGHFGCNRFYMLDLPL
ncbi:MAG TPA: GNAT family N-acetyltransferase [Polyangium sp.]|nr:GNAT family N-acetyltransferase [Polyangium sp.]